MSNVSIDSPRPTLRLLEGPSAPPWTGGQPQINLRAWPFRPGEAPVSRFVDLEETSDALARARARETGLPLALWVRIAVEAARAETCISQDAGSDRLEVRRAIDAVAAAPYWRDTGVLPGRGWVDYAEALVAGRSLRMQPAGSIELVLPEDLAVAWKRTAACAGISLAAWIAQTIADAPADCVLWEAASAAELRPMGEWAYSAWARRSTASSATP